jgi:6-phosphogluconolactonase
MRNNTGIHIFDDKNEITDFMLGKWQELSWKSISGKGIFAVALSGGKTPRDFYRKLAETGENPAWRKTHLFLADERFVPFSDPDSNYGMLNDLLLSRINIRPGNCHPVPVSEVSPEIAAEKYEDEIRSFFKLREKALPEFDLIMLGIGEDGHTASLFPDTKALKDRTHIAFPVCLDPEKHNRITLTLQVINNSKNIILLATGKKKAEVIRRVLKEDDASLPAALVKPKSGKLSFLIDREASSCL